MGALVCRGNKLPWVSFQTCSTPPLSRISHCPEVQESGLFVRPVSPIFPLWPGIMIKPCDSHFSMIFWR